jgi:hypothetical protein
MKIVVLKGAEPGQRETMWVTRTDGTSDQVPINMAHDLPHLVIESAFCVEFGWWGLVDAGAFEREIRAARSHDGKRAKDGRHGVLMGLARHSPLSDESLDPMVVEHNDELLAGKALTNAFRGEPTPDVVRERLRAASEVNDVVRAAIDGLQDDRILELLARLRDYEQTWQAVPAGGRLELTWPLDQV